MLLATSSPSPENECQRSVNDFRPCILACQGALRLLWSIIELSTTSLGTDASTTSLQCHKMSINRASTIFDLASWIIQWQWNVGNPQWTHRQPLWAKLLVAISRPPPIIELPQSVNSFLWGSERYTTMNCIGLLLNQVLRSQSLQSNLVYNFTNMHAMSYRSDCVTCSSRVNIYEPAVCCAISLLSAVFRVGFPSCLFLTAMSDSKSLNTSLFMVMIIAKNECVFIRDLGDRTLQILFDAWWASMNVDSKRPIAWNNSRHSPSWWFCLHCGIEDTGSPGIICLINHHLLRHPSEHGTSSMGKHLLKKAHIAKLNESTESVVTELTSSTVDETALAILRRKGSRGITIVSSQRMIRFHIDVDPYWLKWQTIRSKRAAKEFETSEFHQGTWNHYLMLVIVSAQITWKPMTNPELRRSYEALRDDLVLPSTTTLSNICQREYAMIVDAIEKQLPSWNKVSLALDGWTSTKKLAIRSVIAYYMDQNSALREVQLAFDEVDRPFFSCFES